MEFRDGSEAVDIRVHKWEKTIRVYAGDHEGRAGHSFPYSEAFGNTGHEQRLT